MTTPKTPKPPAGSSPRAAAFWRTVHEEFEFGTADAELLVDVTRIITTLDRLAESVAAEGLTTTGSTGQTRVHPAVAEHRQQAVALGRLLSQLHLPDEAGDALASPLQARSRAGNAAKAGKWGPR